MNTMIISILSVVLFCACCFKLLQAITYRVPLFNQSPYAKAALRVEKAYKVFAWTIMTGFFLFSLVISFTQVFTSVA